MKTIRPTQKAARAAIERGDLAEAHRLATAAHPKQWAYDMLSEIAHARVLAAPPVVGHP